MNQSVLSHTLFGQEYLNGNSCDACSDVVGAQRCVKRASRARHPSVCACKGTFSWLMSIKLNCDGYKQCINTFVMNSLLASDTAIG